nr:immunoglobulin light chain junction region [Macaca mulatta]
DYYCWLYYTGTWVF